MCSLLSVSTELIFPGMWSNCIIIFDVCRGLSCEVVNKGSVLLLKLGGGRGCVACDDGLVVSKKAAMPPLGLVLQGVSALHLPRLFLQLLGHAR